MEGAELHRIKIYRAARVRIMSHSSWIVAACIWVSCAGLADSMRGLLQNHVGVGISRIPRGGHAWRLLVQTDNQQGAFTGMRHCAVQFSVIKARVVFKSKMNCKCLAARCSEKHSNFLSTPQGQRKSDGASTSRKLRTLPDATSLQEES